MGDHSEYKLLTISLKRPPTYGSLQSQWQTQKQRFHVHQVQTCDTLQGLSLRYNISMEKIRRANNLWINDSIFLHKTLNIPIESETSPSEKTPKDLIDSNHINKQEKNNNEQNNQLAKVNSSNGHGETSSLPDAASCSSNGVTLPTNKVEAVQSYLCRVDEIIAKSKDEIGCLASGSEMSKSVSEDDLFRTRKLMNKHMNRQTSLRPSDLYQTSVRDRMKNGMFSFRKLEQEQDDCL